MVDQTKDSQAAEVATELDLQLDLLKDISPSHYPTLFDRASLQIVHLYLHTETLDTLADKTQDSLVSKLREKGANNTHIKAAQRTFRKHIFGQYLNYVAEKLNESRILKLAINCLVDRACRLHGCGIEGDFKDKLMALVSTSTTDSQRSHVLNGGGDPDQSIAEWKQQEGKSRPRIIRSKTQQPRLHSKAGAREEDNAGSDGLTAPPNSRRRRAKRRRAEHVTSGPASERLLRSKDQDTSSPDDAPGSGESCTLEDVPSTKNNVTSPAASPLTNSGSTQPSNQFLSQTPITDLIFPNNTTLVSHKISTINTIIASLLAKKQARGVRLPPPLTDTHAQTDTTAHEQALKPTSSPSRLSTAGNRLGKRGYKAQADDSRSGQPNNRSDKSSNSTQETGTLKSNPSLGKLRANLLKCWENGKGRRRERITEVVVRRRVERVDSAFWGG